MSKTHKLCGAKSKRTGKPCKGLALDNGRCRMHGGMNTNDKRFLPDSKRNPVGRPPMHGKYSKYLKQRFKDKYEAFVNDPDITNLSDELAQLRAVMAHILEELEQEKYTQDDMDNFSKLAELIRKTADSIFKIETAKKYAMSPEEVQRVMRTIAGIIMRHVEDDDLRSKIVDEIQKIKVS